MNEKNNTHMLNQKEERQIRKYCLYPKIALAALIVSAGLCFLLLPLEMINDLVFHQERFQPAGLYTALGFVAIYVIIFCYCTLYSRCGMRGKKWKALQERMNVEQTETDLTGQIAGTLTMQTAGRMMKGSNDDATKHLGKVAEVAGAVTAITTATGALSETSANAKNMALAYGVSVPDIKKLLIAFVLLPVLVLIGIYIPQYVQESQKMRENIAYSAEQMDLVKNALSPICEYVSAADPKVSEYGNNYVTGYLKERKSGVQASYVTLTFDKNGTVTGVTYHEEIDVNASFEENLNRIQKDFDTLQMPLGQLEVSVLNPELLELHDLPDQFKEAFLSGTLYDSISMNTAEDPVQVMCSFNTESKESFNEYSRPEIRLVLLGQE